MKVQPAFAGGNERTKSPLRQQQVLVQAGEQKWELDVAAEKHGELKEAANATQHS